MVGKTARTTSSSLEISPYWEDMAIGGESHLPTHSRDWFLIPKILYLEAQLRQTSYSEMEQVCFSVQIGEFDMVQFNMESSYVSRKRCWLPSEDYNANIYQHQGLSKVESILYFWSSSLSSICFLCDE